MSAEAVSPCGQRALAAEAEVTKLTEARDTEGRWHDWWRAKAAEVQRERDAALAQVTTLTARVGLLQEMVDLLTEAESRSLGFLSAHGWYTDPGLIERGKQIRNSVAALGDSAERTEP